MTAQLQAVNERHMTVERLTNWLLMIEEHTPMGLTFFLKASVTDLLLRATVVRVGARCKGHGHFEIGQGVNWTERFGFRGGFRDLFFWCFLYIRTEEYLTCLLQSRCNLIIIRYLQVLFKISEEIIRASLQQWTLSFSFSFGCIKIGNSAFYLIWKLLPISIFTGEELQTCSQRLAAVPAQGSRWKRVCLLVS